MATGNNARYKRPLRLFIQADPVDEMNDPIDSNIHNDGAELIQELDRSLSSTQVPFSFIRKQFDDAEVQPRSLIWLI